MGALLEVYRELDEGSAEALSDAASIIAQELGLLGSYSTLKWTSEPKVGIAVVGGNAAVSIANNESYEKLVDAVQRGSNCQGLETDLALQQHNLPYGPDDEFNAGTRSGIDAREAILSGDKRVANGNLWYTLNKLLDCGLNDRIGRIDRASREAVRLKRMLAIPVIGLDPAIHPLSQTYLYKVVGEELNVLLPVIKLSPVQVRFRLGVKIGESIKDYGFLEKVDQ